MNEHLRKRWELRMMEDTLAQYPHSTDNHVIKALQWAVVVSFCSIPVLALSAVVFLILAYVDVAAILFSVATFLAIAILPWLNAHLKLREQLREAKKIRDSLQKQIAEYTESGKN